jgi:hypothetical protein
VRTIFKSNANGRVATYFSEPDNSGRSVRAREVVLGALLSGSYPTTADQHAVADRKPSKIL